MDDATIDKLEAHIAELEKENTCLRDKIKRFGNTDDPTAFDWKILHRMDELEAIVEKLPKTADGVPVVPGDGHWWNRRLHNGTYQTHDITVTSIQECGIVFDYCSINETYGRASECYSTREAALKAAAASGGG